MLNEEKRLTEDRFLSCALERLRENYFKKRQTVQELFDLENLKNRIKTIKEKSTERLEENSAKLIELLKEKGISATFAHNAQEALLSIESILRNSNSKRIVKAKSLTTEEIQLNRYLKERGYEVTETDLGEWLVQINDEAPTHMTAPAIHMPKERIKKLLEDKFQVKLTGDVNEMVNFARSRIRKHFFRADCGIIGANAVSLESGSFFLLSNEGNIQNVIRQKLLICIIGMDKIVQKDEEAFEIVQMLPKAATGQIATSYLDVLKKPFGEFHVIILDNGRTSIKSEKEFSEILHCIRCGACQNACPVYTTVSGLLFKGKAYAGPIGILLSYMSGDTANIREYANMCIGCMACDEICSSKIEIQKLIMLIKAKYTKNTPGLKGLIIKHLENRYWLLRIGVYISHFLFKDSLKTGIDRIDKAIGNDYRPLPGIKPSFDIIKAQKKKIMLFAGCSTNFIYPDIGKSALSIARKLGIEIGVIKQKSCCGAPAWYNGEEKSAKKAVKINVEHLLSLECDKILFLDPHCAHMVERDYRLLYKTEQSEQLSQKVFCAGAFFVNLIQEKGLSIKPLGAFIGYHHPCHLKRGLDSSKPLEEFLKRYEPNFVEIKDSDRCCGFAGSYSIMHPYISKKLLKEKLKNMEEASLQVLITACPGCIMQIGGGAKSKRLNVEILHFVSYLDKIL